MLSGKGAGVWLMPMLALTWAVSAWGAECASCAQWNEPREPFRIFGNTYYVGTAAVASILIVSDRGLVLIDGVTMQSPPAIAANIRKLGFRIEDVRLILNTHAHYDHAGGIAGLQQMSGAAVKASPASAPVLASGRASANDPQHDIAEVFTAARDVTTFADGAVLRVGPLAVTAHFTPGHTPGGTSWTWDACEASRCLHIAYPDSLTAVSAPAFSFAHSRAYPGVLADFRHSFDAVANLPCDIAIAPHPDSIGFWERLARRERGEADALVDPAACRRYAQSSRERLDKRLAQERAEP